MLLRIAVMSDDRVFCAALLALLHHDSFEATAHEVDDAESLNDYHLALLDARAAGAFAICHQLTIAGYPVLFVGAPTDDDWARQAITAGACGILTKAAHPEDVTHAIRIVGSGGMWVMRRWLRPPALAPRMSVAGDFADANLSRREKEVLHQAAMGAGNKLLADRLGISESTVKVHLTHIFQKLHVSGRSELVAMYHRLLRTDDAGRKRLA